MPLTINFIARQKRRALLSGLSSAILILAQGTFRSPYVVPALAGFHGATG